MNEWRLQLATMSGALVVGGWFCGCRPVPPPVAAPPTTAPTASATDQIAPDAPPTTVAVRPQPAEPKAVPPANVDPGLRDIAGRLLEPTSEAGWRINEPAALELERLGSEAPAKLLPLLGDEKTEVRRGVAFHLLSSFDPASREQVAAYTKLLSDQDAFVRGFALQAARQMQPDDIATATPQLLTLLDPQHETKSENRAALARFAGSLAQKGLPFARTVSKTAVNDPDERVRSAAIFALTQISKPADYLPTLQKGLADKQASVRLVAAGRLRAIGTEAQPAADALGKTLSDDDERVRTAAAEALVKIGAAAIPVLSEQLESKNVNAKKLALACLSSFGAGAKGELAKIEKLQQDPDADIREAAKVLAGRLKG